MAFGYTELTLALDSNEVLVFDIKESDGTGVSLASYSSGVCSITNIKSGASKNIGSVAIEPSGQTGRIEVTISSSSVLESDTFFNQDEYDLYGVPPLNFALSVKLGNEVKIRAKARMVKVG